MDRLLELWSLLYYLIVQGFGLVLAGAAAVVFLYIVLRKLRSFRDTLLLAAFFVGVMLFFWFPVGVARDLQYPFGLTTYGPADGPALPLRNVFAFFGKLDSFARVADIARDPEDVPAPTARSEEAHVTIELTVKEVMSEVAPGVKVNYWTFDGTVPGPMLRVREGDTVTLTLRNDASSLHMHSIDLHAVTGPGGGATVTTSSRDRARPSPSRHSIPASTSTTAPTRTWRTTWRTACTGSSSSSPKMGCRRLIGSSTLCRASSTRPARGARRGCR
jgi:FtsP/CotA-like multicopper oxidase with cupredoxin domain